MGDFVLLPGCLQASTAEFHRRKRLIVHKYHENRFALCVAIRYSKEPIIQHYQRVGILIMRVIHVQSGS